MRDLPEFNIREPKLCHPKLDNDSSGVILEAKELDKLKPHDTVLLKDGDEWFSVAIVCIDSDLTMEGIVESEVYDSEYGIGSGSIIRFHRDFIYKILE